MSRRDRAVCDAAEALCDFEAEHETLEPPRTSVSGHPIPTTGQRPAADNPPSAAGQPNLDQLVQRWRLRAANLAEPSSARWELRLAAAELEIELNQ